MKTILIAEDDSILRFIYQEILEKSGYYCLITVNGQEAVDMYKDKGDTIDITLLDMSMPVMRGDRALHEILKLDRSAPVIIISGYLGPVTTAEGLLKAGARRIVMKPISSEQLLKLIEEYT